MKLEFQQVLTYEEFAQAVEDDMYNDMKRTYTRKNIQRYLQTPEALRTLRHLYKSAQDRYSGNVVYLKEPFKNAYVDGVSQASYCLSLMFG